jgi:tetratricopeptide (TPR) repeat protein
MPESISGRTKSLLELQRLVVTTFDLEELQMVAFALGVDWDELKGSTKSLKTVALIQHIDRRAQIDPLLVLLREERPNVPWPTILPPDPSTLPPTEFPPDPPGSIFVQSQTGGTVNVGNIVTGDVEGDIVQGDRVSGDIVISGSIVGNVQINYQEAPDIPSPPPPTPPPEVPLFIGREAELAYFQNMLARTGFALISGMPGVGKTVLAAELAQRLDRPQQTFWHMFHEGEGIDTVIWRVAGFLTWHEQDDLWRLLQNARLTNGQPPPPELLFEYLAQLLRGRNYVLCLDDFHHVDDDPLLTRLVEQLRPLLSGQELQMIVTTRRMPEFIQRAEEFEPLDGLTLADTQALLEAQEITLDEGRLGQLHIYSGGNPELLSLAIDLLRNSTGATALMERLIETTDVERFFLDEVDGLLTRDERLVMSAVAVLQGYPAARQAIEAVLNGRSARRILNDLTDRSLLTVRRVEEERLYSQHAIVRDFYYSSLGRAQRVEMHLRAAEYYQGEGADDFLAARHYRLGEAYYEAADLITADVRRFINRGQTQQLGNLLAAFEKSQLDTMRWINVKIAQGEVHSYLGESQAANNAFQEAIAILKDLSNSDEVRLATARACLGMGDVLSRKAPENALPWLERGLSTLGELDSQLKAALLLQNGEANMYMSRYEKAQEFLESGLQMLPPEPSQLRASALENLGAIAVLQHGDIPTSLRFAEEALAMSRNMADTFRVARLSSMVGGLQQMSNDWLSARSYLEEAVGIAKRLGNDRVLAQSTMNLGVMLIYLGDFDEARRQLTTALELARRTDQFVGASLTLLNLADVAIRTGDWQGAVPLVDEAERISHELQLDGNRPRIAQFRALIAIGQGELEAALLQAEEAVRLAGETEDELGIGKGERIRGQTLSAMGRMAEAEKAFRHSVKLLEAHDRYEMARTYAEWSMMTRHNGQSEQAQELGEKSRHIFEELGAVGDLARLESV